MSHTITVEEAAGRLAELIATLAPGDEITLVSKNQPVARLTPAAKRTLPRAFGACKGMLMKNPDVPENVYLDDFKDYM
ncbi:MAG TPA: type II toxin-antitoxin system prevent-host-death family antitoxin [Phycisphaerae bacterium]|nr:type II toxin-antitoxin system prevent-host-death family antitoxin [Phycisphaerae bacterium]